MILVVVRDKDVRRPMSPIKKSSYTRPLVWRPSINHRTPKAEEINCCIYAVEVANPEAVDTTMVGRGLTHAKHVACKR